MLNPADMNFKRRFSVNPYKTLRMPLGQMDCHKDWVNDTHGDPYPVTASNETDDRSLTETLPFSRWSLENHTDVPLYKARLLGGLILCATYELRFSRILPDDGSRSGILIQIPDGISQSVTVSNSRGNVVLTLRTFSQKQLISQSETITGIPFEKDMGLMVTIGGQGFLNCYLSFGDHIQLVRSAVIVELNKIDCQDIFMNSTVSAYAELMPGASFLGIAEFYLDAGASQADMKAIRTEDGLPLIENGRIFLTVSVREELGGYQAVLSWKPGTSDFRMEGALFFDYGDGRWCGDIASSIVLDRRTGLWLIWACAFSQGHILCHAVSRSDPRFGITVLDAVLMPRETLPDGGFLTEDGKASVSDDSSFLSKWGDEDPDLMFDSSIGKWRLILCRSVRDGARNRYRYFSFVSDAPFDGFTFLGQTVSGSVTGGSIVTVEGIPYLICGSDRDKRACYRVYPIDDLDSCRFLRFDYDDGGYRGWGTLLPVPCGTRIRYYLITFDRHNCSCVNNWSYGNLYVFESDRMSRN